MTCTEHNLPFNELSDRQFEQLCFALLQAEGHSDVRHWGDAGAEGGCDIVSTDQKGRRWVTQAKRTRELGPTPAVKELKKVLDDPPDPEPAVYLLAASCALSRKTEKALAKEIARRGKAWEVILWGRTELDAKIRDHPEVRGRFFGADASAVPPDVDTEIDEAFRYVRDGRPEITIDLLEKLKRRRWDRLSSRQRYRLLANLGTATLGTGQAETAGRYYIQAAKHQRLDEDARSLEAHGYLLLGDDKNAYELAVALCQDSPDLGRAQMVRVQAAPKELSFDELLDSVPNVARGRPQVAWALHNRAVEHERLADSERILREANAMPSWPSVGLALGSTILQQELERITDFFEGRIVTERLSEAEELFTNVLEQIPKGDPEKLSFDAYLGRGTCRRYFGNLDQARADFRRARECMTSDERSVIRLAASAYPDREDPDGAIRILEAYLSEQKSLHIEVFLAECLYKRNGGRDLERARVLLEPLVPRLSEFEDGEFREQIVAILVDIYQNTERGELAVRLVEELADGTLEAVARHAISGKLLLRLGRTEAALSEARAARDALSDSSPRTEVARVAFLLEKLERYDEAFEQWRRIASPEFVSLENRHLLNCAKLAKDDAFILNYCRELRTAGNFDRLAVDIEFNTLIRYSEYTSARDLLQAYLAAIPEDKTARLNLSVLAIQRGWEDLIEQEPDRLPSVEELESPETGEIVAFVLRAGPDRTQAVDYSYDLYRRFPDEPASHRALIAAVHAPAPTDLRIEKPKTVLPGSAVCYTELGTDERHWLVVEDAPNPSLSRGEFASSSGLVPALLGKSIGCEFPLSDGGLLERTGAVIDIQDKRIYRSNQLIFAWADRFPGDPFLAPVRIKVSDSPSQEDFADMIKMMERLNEQREKIFDDYRNGKISISTIARLNDRSVFETVTHLASEPELQIRTCGGPIQDLEQAVRLLDDVRSTLLDPTAIATLALMGEINILESLPFKCVVTEGTLQELRNLVREDSPTRQADGFIGSKDGRLWIHEVDAEEEAKWLQRLRKALSDLEGKCNVIGGTDLAKVDTDLRELLTKYVTQGSAETAAAAAERGKEGTAIWTDDHILFTQVRTELPAPRVWTQSVLVWASRRGFVERKFTSRISARLLRFGYFFTSLDPRMVLDTCEAASWRPEDPDLSAVLADFGNRGWERGVALRMTAETVARIWQESPTEEHARLVTARLLAHLADRDDHKDIARFLVANMDSLLGLALTREDGLRQVLRMFLQCGVVSL
ncbi:MAG: hypothetical protein GY835_16235 [bacterium]|nr:hypothetical protein [bacterium]